MLHCTNSDSRLAGEAGWRTAGDRLLLLVYIQAAVYSDYVNAKSIWWWYTIITPILSTCIYNVLYIHTNTHVDTNVCEYNLHTATSDNTHSISRTVFSSDRRTGFAAIYVEYIVEHQLFKLYCCNTKSLIFEQPNAIILLYRLWTQKLSYSITIYLLTSTDTKKYLSFISLLHQCPESYVSKFLRKLQISRGQNSVIHYEVTHMRDKQVKDTLANGRRCLYYGKYPLFQSVSRLDVRKCDSRFTVGVW